MEQEDRTWLVQIVYCIAERYMDRWRRQTAELYADMMDECRNEIVTAIEGYGRDEAPAADPAPRRRQYAYVRPDNLARSIARRTGIDPLDIRKRMEAFGEWLVDYKGSPAFPRDKADRIEDVYGIRSRTHGAK